MPTLQEVPLHIAIAPYPEGWSGDADEFGQQLVQLMSAYLEGNFLVGLVLPPGSTLPTNDQGPIFMGGVWYWWNPATGTYVPQSLPVKPTKNYVKNCIYQIQQTGSAFSSLPAARTPIFDLSIAALSQANVLSVGVMAGPSAGGLNDFINSAIQYTVGTTLVPTPVATDLLAHEHLIEGSDIQALQGQVTSLSFWAWTTAPGTYSVYLTNNGRDHSYVVNFTLGTASTWTYITVPNIPAFPTGGTWNYNEGATGLYIGVPMVVGTQWQTANLGSWQPAFLAGSASNINFCAVTNNKLAITGIKLEANPQSTYLSVPSLEADLHDAIRYYWTSYNYRQTGLGQGVPVQGVAPVAGYTSIAFTFPRCMAKTPVISFNSWQNNTAGSISDMSLGIDVPISAPGTIKPKGFYHNAAISNVQNGTLNATTTITGLTSTTNLAVGMAVSGTNIPAGATIATIASGTSVTISAATTGSGTVSLTFLQSVRGDTLAAIVTADARLS